MKVKKFKNIWLMGIIIFAMILVGVYVAKIIFPNFVVGVAENESIIKFGNYIDNNWWAYYLFYFTISFITGYLYCCACCRKNKLAKKDILILTIEVVLLFIVEKYLVDFYLEINIFCMLLMPTLICLTDKRESIEYFYSTIVCFIIHSVSQILSLCIRDIGMMVTTTNSATFTILLIDVYIWQFLLYNFFNFKGVKENGKT